MKSYKHSMSINMLIVHSTNLSLRSKKNLDVLRERALPFVLPSFLVVTRTVAIAVISAIAAYERTIGLCPQESSGLVLLGSSDVRWLFAPLSRTFPLTGNSSLNHACKVREEEEVEQE